jgi:hypothetical protein
VAFLAAVFFAAGAGAFLAGAAFFAGAVAFAGAFFAGAFSAAFGALFAGALPGAFFAAAFGLAADFLEAAVDELEDNEFPLGQTWICVLGAAKPVPVNSRAAHSVMGPVKSTIGWGVGHTRVTDRGPRPPERGSPGALRDYRRTPGQVPRFKPMPGRRMQLWVYGVLALVAVAAIAVIAVRA